MDQESVKRADEARRFVSERYGVPEEYLRVRPDTDGSFIVSFVGVGEQLLLDSEGFLRDLERS